MKNLFRILLAAVVSLIIVGCEDYELDEPGNLVPKTVVDDPSIPSITVNGVKLH